MPDYDLIFATQTPVTPPPFPYISARLSTIITMRANKLQYKTNMNLTLTPLYILP